jgi:hypothetical protein
MYTIHLMNLKINIWTLNFLFKSKNWYFNYENYYFNFFLKKGFETWYLNLKLLFQLFKTLFEFQIFDLSMIFKLKLKKVYLI